MSKAPDGIKRGRMSPEEKLLIAHLCETMKDPTPGKVARKLNRHIATVTWHMLTRGLLERPVGRIPHAYQRNGQTIHPYAVEHDAFIEDARSQGKKFKEIGELLTAKFGIPRTGHSVQVRIVQLAAAPDETLPEPVRQLAGAA